jgi:hypothetical protein
MAQPTTILAAVFPISVEPSSRVIFIIAAHRHPGRGTRLSRMNRRTQECVRPTLYNRNVLS